MTFRLLDAMPAKSEVMIYGSLAGEAGQVNPQHLIFQQKRVTGFWLTSWLADNNLIKTISTARNVQKLLSGDLETAVQAHTPLENIHQAIEQYQQNMTASKVLILPNGII